MRRYSVRPAITLRGRTFKGPRGWAGKPFHPPLTDFPIVCYVLAAIFDQSPGGLIERLDDLGLRRPSFG